MPSLFVVVGFQNQLSLGRTNRTISVVQETDEPPDSGHGFEFVAANIVCEQQPWVWPNALGINGSDSIIERKFLWFTKLRRWLSCWDSVF